MNDQNPTKKSTKRSDASREQFRIKRLRNVLSGVLISVLIGLAFQEMVAPVRDSVRSVGFTWATFLIAVIFFLTSVRFFIGNQLHLLNEDLLAMSGFVWFYDLVWILLQTLVLVFLGGVASYEATSIASVSFVTMLIVLFVIDVFWICSQWLLGNLLPGWKREFIPWGWAILNSSQVICLLFLKFVVANIYEGFGLFFLVAINIVAFVVDILLLDYYDVFENLETETLILENNV